MMMSKKAWFLYAVATRFIPVPRLWHDFGGITLSWYVFDRGEKGPLVRLLQRRHLHDIQQIEHPADRRMASLLDWVLGSACADHDVQNGLCNSCRQQHHV